MIHFNELYITEDEKHLVIDTEIDNLPIYSGCVIDTITVSASPDCDKANMKTMTVYDNNAYKGTVIDMNNDGEITWKDVSLMEELASLLEKLNFTEEDFTKFDLNKDGKIDALDIYEIVDEILHKQSNDPKYELDGQEGVNIGDVNYLIGVIQSAAHVLSNDESTRLTELLNYLQNATITGKLTKDLSHVRLCLGEFELMKVLAEDKAFGDHIFTVTVEAKCDNATNQNLAEMTKLSCGWDVNTIRGIAYNDKKLYDEAISLASSYSDDCDNNDSSGFVDFILRYYAFIFALKCGDIDQACYYWNNYLKSGSSVSGNKSMPRGGGCGCHGSRW